MRRGTRHRYTRTFLLDVLAAQGRRPTWLASQMGIDYTYLYKVTRGHKPITERFVRDACRVLGLPEAALFAASDLREGNEIVPVGSEAA